MICEVLEVCALWKRPTSRVLSRFQFLSNTTSMFPQMELVDIDDTDHLCLPMNTLPVNETLQVNRRTRQSIGTMRRMSSVGCADNG